MAVFAGILGFVHILGCRPSQLSKLHQEQSLRGVRQTSLLILGDYWTCFWDLIAKDFDKSCKWTEHEAAIKRRMFCSAEAGESLFGVMRLVAQQCLCHSNLSVSVL